MLTLYSIKPQVKTPSRSKTEVAHRKTRAILEPFSFTACLVISNHAYCSGRNISNLKCRIAKYGHSCSLKTEHLSDTAVFREWEAVIHSVMERNMNNTNQGTEGRGMKYLFHDGFVGPARPMLIPVQPALASTAWVWLMSIATASPTLWPPKPSKD